MESPFCGHRILAMIRFQLKGETYFLLLYIFENGFGVVTYFTFLRENKIRKKTLNVTHNKKNKSVKTESRFRVQVTYWEGTVKNCSTPLST